MNNSVNYKLKYLNNKRLYYDSKHQDGGTSFFSSNSKTTTDIRKLLVKIIENAYDNDKIDEVIQHKIEKKDEKNYIIGQYIYIKEVLDILKQIFNKLQDHKIDQQYALETVLQELVGVQESERKFVQSNFPTRNKFIQKYKIQNLRDRDILHEPEVSKNNSEPKTENDNKTD